MNHQMFYRGATVPDPEVLRRRAAAFRKTAARVRRRAARSLEAAQDYERRADEYEQEADALSIHKEREPMICTSRHRPGARYFDGEDRIVTCARISRHLGFHRFRGFEWDDEHAAIVTSWSTLREQERTALIASFDTRGNGVIHPRDRELLAAFDRETRELYATARTTSPSSVPERSAE